MVAGLLLGIVVAFPAGLMLGRADQPAKESRAAEPEAREGLRNPYSPRMLSDPAVVAGHRESVEAMEDHCERTGELCAEARAGRRWLAEQRGRD
jgi:hypothetical protein